MILVRVGSWEAIPKPNKDEQHLSILWQIKQNNAASQTVADFNRRLQTQYREPGILQTSLYVLQEFGPILVPPVFYWTASGEYSWSVIKLSKNVPYVQFKYRFMLLFFYSIQLLIFFSLNNFSSLHHLSKYSDNLNFFDFYMSYLKLEFRSNAWILSSPKKTCLHIWLSLSPKDSLFLSVT